MSYPSIRPSPTPKIVHQNTNAEGVASHTTRIEEATRIDEPDANTTYIGYAELGTNPNSEKWKIKKITLSGTETIIQYADGDRLYDNIWVNRVSLNYS